MASQGEAPDCKVPRVASDEHDGHGDEGSQRMPLARHIRYRRLAHQSRCGQLFSCEARMWPWSQAGEARFRNHLLACPSCNKATTITHSRRAHHPPANRSTTNHNTNYTLDMRLLTRRAATTSPSTALLRRRRRRECSCTTNGQGPRRLARWTYTCCPAEYVYTLPSRINPSNARLQATGAKERSWRFA